MIKNLPPFPAKARFFSVGLNTQHQPPLLYVAILGSFAAVAANKVVDPGNNNTGYKEINKTP